MTGEGDCTVGLILVLSLVHSCSGGKRWVVWGANFVCSRVTEVSQAQKDLLAPRVTQEIKVPV